MTVFRSSIGNFQSSIGANGQQKGADGLFIGANGQQKGADGSFICANGQQKGADESFICADERPIGADGSSGDNFSKTEFVFHIIINQLVTL